MTKYIDEMGTFEVPAGSTLRRELVIRRLVAAGLSRERAEYHAGHNTVYPEVLSYIIPVDRTIEETFSMPDYRDAAEKERLMQVLDGIESVEPRVNRRFGPFEMTQYDDERIAWVQIGRFHLRVETSTVYAERSFVVGIGTKMMSVMFR